MIDWSDSLSKAARNGDLAIVREALGYGADIEAENEVGFRPLHVAAANGHTEVVRFLLDHGADINARDRYQTTALHRAASQGHDQVVRFLLERDAWVSLKDGIGRTALHFTVSYDHDLPVHLLMAHGADLESRDDQQRTPLQYAVNFARPKSVRALLAHHPDLEQKNRWGQSLLELVATGDGPEHGEVALCLYQAMGLSPFDKHEGWPLAKRFTDGSAAQRVIHHAKRAHQADQLRKSLHSKISADMLATEAAGQASGPKKTRGLAL